MYKLPAALNFLVLLGIVPFAFAQSYDQPFEAEMNLTPDNTQMPWLEYTKFSYKNEKQFRMENHFGRDIPVTVSVRNGIKSYSYTVPGDVAYPVPLEAKEIFYFLFLNNCVSIGQESVDGKLCDIKQCDSSFYGVNFPIKIWVGQDSNFPVKFETSKGKYFLRNVKVNPKLDDSLFSLPENIKAVGD